MRLGFAGGALAVIAVILLIVGYSSLFQVYQTRQALVVRLGNPHARGHAARPACEDPAVDTVIYVDKRILDLENPSQEVIAADQKQLIVDAFARYRVVDALKFYQTVGTVDGANSRLAPFLNSALRAALGEATLTQVVRDQREQLMARVREQLDREAQQFGVEVVDVRIRRADLPEQNSNAVYTRMQTEREREAQEFRSQGTQKAQEIRARADRDATVIVAEATSGRSRRAARAMPSATASSPTPSTGIRTSSPSIARCRPTRPACSRAIPGLVLARLGFLPLLPRSERQAAPRAAPSAGATPRRARRVEHAAPSVRESHVRLSRRPRSRLRDRGHRLRGLPGGREARRQGDAGDPGYGAPPGRPRQRRCRRAAGLADSRLTGGRELHAALFARRALAAAQTVGKLLGCDATAGPQPCRQAAGRYSASIGS